MQNCGVFDTPFGVLSYICGEPTPTRTMTNDEFRAYIDEKVAWIRKTLRDPEASPEDKSRAREAEPLFIDAQKMARHTAGPAFRRFRREFERRRKL